MRAQGHPGLERRFSRRRLAPCLRRARLRSRDPAARGQGKRHPAAARHPAAHGRGPAEDPARTEGARLSHRSRGARDAGTAGDADRAAAMAIASGIGDGGDLALAENSEICVCQHRSTPRPGSRRPRLAQHRSRPTYAAARARRSAAADNAVAETNHIAAGPHACRTAGSGREHFHDPGIDPRHDAGQGSDQRRPTAQTPRATEVSAKLAGKPRRHRGPAAAQPAASATQPPEEANGTAPRPAARGQEERPIRSRCRLRRSAHAS